MTDNATQRLLGYGAAKKWNRREMIRTLPVHTIRQDRGVIVVTSSQPMNRTQVRFILDEAYGIALYAPKRVNAHIWHSKIAPAPARAADLPDGSDIQDQRQRMAVKRSTGRSAESEALSNLEGFDWTNLTA